MVEQQYEWRTWLKRWNDLLLQRLDRADLPYYPPDDVLAVESGWLGFDAAAEAEVQQLETRLGKKMPASYRQFLLTSNGFRQPGMLVPSLYPAHKVENLARIDPELVKVWLEWDTVFDADPALDDTSYFVQHIQALVVISEEEVAGTARYLLNPERVNENGEWEAYYYAHWQPGATRYASFWELMQREFAFRRDYGD